jgi:hypothetical protein
MGEPIDHPGAPAFGSLPGQYVPADGPVEEYQLPADGKRSPDLGILDATFQVLKQFWVTGRGLERFLHGISLARDLLRQLALSLAINIDLE